MEKIKIMLTGFIAGMISGLFASGGGLILVPAFLYILKMEERKARGTAICCILPMVLASSLWYYKDNYMDWRIGMKCAIRRNSWRNTRGKIIEKVTHKIYKNSF